jgi:glycosyltransferase involved in cell wall biosynthesis
MYGSDRSFLQVMEYLVQSGKYSKITVVLPRLGPLSERLVPLGVDLQIMELSLLSKTHLKKLQWGKIVLPLFQLRKKANLIGQYDVLYVNTSVILDFYLLGPFLRLKKIIHVREIPGRLMSGILSNFIKASHAAVIFNSYATKSAFSPFRKSYVIHNAFEGYGDSGNYVFSEDPEPLKILLVGRVNTWKGQDFAISALRELGNENFILRIVGSTSVGNEDLLVALQKEVDTFGLAQKVVFEDFCEDPEQVYRWSDLVIVPSKKPEPFGRIAIEAMSVGKPLVVADHGGLREIVDEGCGTLFTPNDEASFREAILKYLHHRSLLTRQGEAARNRYENKFSIAGFHRQLEIVF